MVEICVEVPDATGALGLIRNLRGLFERYSVSFDGTRNEVRVRSEWESRSVDHVIDMVEWWLGVVGAGPAKLSIDDRSYTVVGRAPLVTQVGKQR
jgi:hypothetical protein